MLIGRQPMLQHVQHWARREGGESLNCTDLCQHCGMMSSRPLTATDALHCRHASVVVSTAQYVI